MYFNAFFSLIFSLAAFLLFSDIHIAQAQNCCNPNDRQCLKKKPRRPICSCSGGGCPIPDRIGTRNPTWMPPEQVAQIQNLIAQGRATVGDYLLLAYDNAQKGQYSSAEANYMQALELAKKNGDMDGQATAHHGLGAVYAASNKTAEASRQLQTAQEIYKIIGNQQRLRDIQQLQRVNKLQISPQLQIPSQLQQR